MKKTIMIQCMLAMVPSFLHAQWVFPGFSGDPFWGGHVDILEDTETRAIVSYISDPAKMGEAAARIDWGATHSADWGGSTSLKHFNMDSTAVYDFSPYDSLIFWYDNLMPSDLPGTVHFRFNLCDVSDSENGAKTYDVAETEYWYSFHTILDDDPGWKRIALPLADVREDPNGLGFDLKGWYGIAGNDMLDLDQIKGFQMEFSIASAMGDVAFGTFVLDGLMLTSAGGDTMAFLGFEGNPFWGGQVDITEDTETNAVISYVSDPVQVGNAAMRVDWGVTHNQSWGGGAYLRHFHFDSLKVYDFSPYDSLIFWYNNFMPSDLPGTVHLRFNLCDVSDSPSGAKTYNTGETEYWYSFHYILDDLPGWNRISIPLADVREDPNGLGFDRKGWYGIEGNDILDLDQIKGFQMEFSMASAMGDIAFGTIVLDELTLVREGWQNAVPEAPAGPAAFRLSQNYPNQFNPSTSIPFTLAHDSRVRIAVFDLQGRRITVLEDGRFPAGSHAVHFSAGNLPSGAYVYQIDADSGSLRRKMVLIK